MSSSFNYIIGIRRFDLDLKISTIFFLKVSAESKLFTENPTFRKLLQKQTLNGAAIDLSLSEKLRWKFEFWTALLQKKISADQQWYFACTLKQHWAALKSMKSLKQWCSPLIFSGTSTRVGILFSQLMTLNWSSFEAWAANDFWFSASSSRLVLGTSQIKQTCICQYVRFLSNIVKSALRNSLSVVQKSREVFILNQPSFSSHTWVINSSFTIAHILNRNSSRALFACSSYFSLIFHLCFFPRNPNCF